MRAPEKRFKFKLNLIKFNIKLKFNEILASSGTLLTLTNFFHNS